MRSSGLRWSLLSATALLLASCAAPYGGYHGGYASYGYPAYGYPEYYYPAAEGGFVIGGRHHFRHRFFGRESGHRFGHHVGGVRDSMIATRGQGGGHHR